MRSLSVVKAQYHGCDGFIDCRIASGNQQISEDNNISESLLKMTFLNRLRNLNRPFICAEGYLFEMERRGNDSFT